MIQMMLSPIQLIFVFLLNPVALALLLAVPIIYALFNMRKEIMVVFKREQPQVGENDPKISKRKLVLVVLINVVVGVVLVVGLAVLGMIATALVIIIVFKNVGDNGAGMGISILIGLLLLVLVPVFVVISLALVPSASRLVLNFFKLNNTPPAFKKWSILLTLTLPALLVLSYYSYNFLYANVIGQYTITDVQGLGLELESVEFDLTNTENTGGSSFTSRIKLKSNLKSPLTIEQIRLTIKQDQGDQTLNFVKDWGALGPSSPGNYYNYPAGLGHDSELGIDTVQLEVVDLSKPLRRGLGVYERLETVEVLCSIRTLQNSFVDEITIVVSTKEPIKQTSEFTYSLSDTNFQEELASLELYLQAPIDCGGAL